ncbi:MAG TPA: LytR C-terminal domain-containing protein [Segeticoccus sp.]|jgi:hypothetical protein|nr:LytR C-terminal domain-containing protein [Segeticoccus sp.]
MSYPHESALAAARRRRHRRAIVTVTLVVLLLLGAFAYSVAYYQRWIGDAQPAAAVPSASSSCRPSATGSGKGKGAGPDALTAQDFTVNVYNATKRSGLASAAGRELSEHGFDVGAVTNDPLEVQVRGVGQVRYGQDGKQQATLVKRWLKGAKLVLDGRTGTSVDLVIGDNYKALTPPPAAEQSISPTC